MMQSYSEKLLIRHNSLSDILISNLIINYTMRVISRFKFMLVAIMAITLSFQMQASSVILEEGNDWTLITEEKGIKAYAQEFVCNGTNMYLFKIENSTGKKVSVDYSIQSFTNPTGGAIQESIQLNPGESKTGDCDAYGELILFNAVASERSLNENVQVKLTIK